MNSDCDTMSAAAKTTFRELVARGDRFLKEARLPKPPTERNWLRAMVAEGRITEERAVAMADGSYPVLHEDVLALCADFLALKKAAPSGEAERRIYADLGVLGLVDRLVRNRPLTFMGTADAYTLRDGRDGSTDWDEVGGANTKATADRYMTYDEIKLAALLQLSSPVAPINK